MLKTLIPMLLIFVSSCVEFEEEAAMTENNSRQSIHSISVAESFNYEGQESVDVNILNSKEASYIIYEIDSLKEGSNVISRFHSTEGLKLKLNVKKDSRRLLLVVSNDEGTSYHYAKIVGGQSLFNLDSY